VSLYRRVRGGPLAEPPPRPALGEIRSSGKFTTTIRFAQAWQGLYAALLAGQEISNPPGWLVVVTATVSDDGVAVINSGSSARIANIAATKVVMPLGDGGPTVVEPSAGALYLRALPFAFRSPYLHAVFVKWNDELRRGPRAASTAATPCPDQRATRCWATAAGASALRAGEAHDWRGSRGEEDVPSHQGDDGEVHVNHDNPLEQRGSFSLAGVAPCLVTHTA
jgi:hypothetical protein